MFIALSRGKVLPSSKAADFGFPATVSLCTHTYRIQEDQRYANAELNDHRHQPCHQIFIETKNADETGILVVDSSD